MHHGKLQVSMSSPISLIHFLWSLRAEAAFRGGLPYYPKMLVGVPFTPAGGTRSVAESIKVEVQLESVWPSSGSNLSQARVPALDSQLGTEGVRPLTTELSPSLSDIEKLTHRLSPLLCTFCPAQDPAEGQPLHPGAERAAQDGGRLLGGDGTKEQHLRCPH